jgi:hypothetical protein
MAARKPRHALALSPRVAAGLAGGVISSFINLDDEGARSDVTRFCGPQIASRRVVGDR